uniref:Homeobox domain-containing protein n=1 Tax=Branchiostoma floridae TaxID=7739 RepID=C3ZLQ2_BRAFL|eukprot:XP_002590514.1 hypothetical protein BRAFLDRAFT_86186 [Branchiostoma floridae]
MDLYKSNPWVYRALITEHLWSGEFNMVFQLIQNYPFGPSADLVQLWDEAHYRQVKGSTGKPLTSVGKFRVRKRFPPPLSIAPHGRKMLTLPREAKKKLQAWFLDHLYHPYPSGAEKYDLAKLTDLTVKQVSTWFQNTRRRLHQQQDTNWDKSPWMDLDITSLKRSQSSPNEEQYYKDCGVSSRVQEEDNERILEEIKTVDNSKGHFSLGYSPISENVSCNESVSTVRNIQGLPQLSYLAANKRYTTQDRCYQGDGDTKCAEDNTTQDISNESAHTQVKCPPHMFAYKESQTHIDGKEKASGLKEQFLPFLDDNSNLQHCAQLCAICSQTCLSSTSVRPTFLHITGGDPHSASTHTSFIPGLYPVHGDVCNAAQQITPRDSSSPHPVTYWGPNPAEPQDPNPVPMTVSGDCLIYTELQTVASLLVSDGTENTKWYTWPTATDGSFPSYGLERLALGDQPGAVATLYSTDIANIAASPGATDTDTVIPVNIAVPGATCPFMSAAFPGAVHDATGTVIPAAVHSATDTGFHIAVPGAEQPAITVDTVATYLKRDPYELTSVACALLDLTSSCVESLGH